MSFYAMVGPRILKLFLIPFLVFPKTRGPTPQAVSPFNRLNEIDLARDIQPPRNRSDRPDVPGPGMRPVSSYELISSTSYVPYEDPLVVLSLLRSVVTRSGIASPLARVELIQTSVDQRINVFKLKRDTVDERPSPILIGQNLARRAINITSIRYLCTLKTGNESIIPLHDREESNKAGSFSLNGIHLHTTIDGLKPGCYADPDVGYGSYLVHVVVE
ncbi:hypothetical protein BDN72DRAFT_931341 [Pluteus cervinus]|uniref:Uncharacterized protein n=1 Tax=Pluteus cervinus TaxID=181527 RepID=A0ACD3B2G3_9AGAR|nr:hypothetical protein BDN72DRAFT_931341 [Pluteus cervinus]